VNSYLVYRGSLYAVLALSTVILTVDVTDSRVDWLLPIGVGLAVVFSFFMVDQGPLWALPRDLANLVALGTLGLLYVEYKVDENQLIRCLGHWVTYLLIIKCMLPKTSRDDWVLFLLSLTQVLIGSVINPGDTLGVWLFVWTMLAVWVLGLFFLHRESGRFEAGPTSDLVATVPPPVDPYRGLFDLPYFAATTRVLALTLVLGGLFFLLLPRQQGATRNRTSGAMSKHLTGFDEEVKLGQLGEILENDSVVMSVEFADEERRPTHPEGEPLFRGVTLVEYENGSWRRRQQRSPQMIVSMKQFRNNGPVRRKVIRQIIKLEPNDSPILFAMRPVLELSAAGRSSPYLNPIDGTLYRPEGRGTYDYEVLSDANFESPQEEEEIPSESRHKALLAIPEGLKARLREIALPLVQDVSKKGSDDVAEKARALESYLRDSGRFSYTLEMNVVDPNLDPVEDFLVNRRRGHCEYFASALTLLLRSIGIPARMVNGFKGGDWNELTQSMNVRQKHAHSWVEAYVGTVEARSVADARGMPIWVVLDPTPGADRDESIARVGGVVTSFRPITDMIRYIWVFYIQGYDRNRQNRLFYTPIATMVQKVRQGYSLLWTWGRRAIAQLFNFQSLGAFISLRGFLVSFLVLSLVAAAFRFLLWLGKRLLRWWRGPIDDTVGLLPGILFYRRLAQMLAEMELRRNSAETQSEFAVRASRFLGGRGDGAEAVAEVPRKVVDAFYRVRFGHLDLDPGTLEELEENLDSLQKYLNTP
jgi:transglutaminase-like putative cysteine protease